MDLVSTAVNSGGLFPWWGWAIALFVFCFALGIVAILAGVGGGVLFVPIVGSFFPFNLDFVRGAGLMVALAGALSAGPRLLRTGLSDLRLGIPFALAGSIFSIMGALVGLALPDYVVQLALGFSILGIVAVMLAARKSDFPQTGPDALAAKLGLGGCYIEGSTGACIDWKVHRVVPAFFLFMGIGFLSGLFGLGAGWANVPAINLFLGAPLKIAVGTSSFIIAVNDTAAAWIYLNRGAILPLIVVPSVTGMMLGTRIGAALLTRIPPKTVKLIVLVFLGLSGIRALLKGFGIWL
jgi:hypothetical protein